MLLLHASPADRPSLTLARRSYVDVLKRATDLLYAFFHTATKNDTGTMESLMSWFLGLVDLSRRYGAPHPARARALHRMLFRLRRRLVFEQDEQ